MHQAFQKLLMGVDFPQMIQARQLFPAVAPVDVAAEIDRGFSSLHNVIKPGAHIAVAVGSRGIANFQTAVSAVLRQLLRRGAKPFIVPAMGSHGGATPEGQRLVLREYGVTEEAMGVAIEASMEVERIGTTPEGVDVFFSKAALKADGIILINRVKPHTDFQGTIGSGLLKIMVVGLGKRDGAANYHIAATRFGYEEVIRAAARVILDCAPIRGAVGIVEGPRHETARIEVLTQKEIEAREPGLFVIARDLMPKLPFPEIDLLILDEIGKNISGSGMDPNVTGRSVHGYSSFLGGKPAAPVIRRIFVRDLTRETRGNGIGIGLADLTTGRLARALDSRVTAINALTSLTPQCAKVPIQFETDREAILAGLASLGGPPLSEVRVVHAANTLSLEKLEISEGLARTAAGRADLSLNGPLYPMRFDSSGNLFPLDSSAI